MAVMARSIEGLPRPPHVIGVSVEPYRNEWSEAFTNAEAMAMEGLAAFTEMGQPTGYEEAEGFDAFAIARDKRDMLGFAQAMVPEGWINWMGVVPAGPPSGRRGACSSPISPGRCARPAAPTWRPWSRSTRPARRSSPRSGSASEGSAAR